MADERLVNYVIELKKRGYSSEAIKDYLVRNSYDSNEVNSAISEVYSKFNVQFNTAQAVSNQGASATGNVGKDDAVIQQLVDFINQQVSKGYSISNIKVFLQKKGYDTNQINRAVAKSGTILHPIKNVNLSSKQLMMIGGGVAIIVSIILFVLFGGGKFEAESSISMNQKEFLIDDSITFKINIQSESDPKVNALFKIQDLSSNAVLVEWEEEAKVSELDGKTITKEIPSSASEGEYIVRSLITYKDYESRAFARFMISSGDDPEPEETCRDGIKNQDETGVDCGGVCSPCRAEVDTETCSDGIKNQDETGVDCGGVCSACEIVDPDPPIEPKETCFDNIKNQNEEGVDCGGRCSPCKIAEATCSDKMKNQDEEGIDCGGSCPPCPVVNVGKDDQEVISDVKELPKSKVNEGLSMCSQLSEDRSIDDCYLALATGNVNESDVCQEIGVDSKADVCYMYFVNMKDYTVCDDITNSYVKRSCKSLKKINELENSPEAKEYRESQLVAVSNADDVEVIEGNTVVTETGSDSATQ